MKMRNTCMTGRRAVLAGIGVLPLLLAVAGRGRAETLPLVSVTRDPSCGCCGGWVDHVRAAGFPVRVVESDDVNSLKQQLGVPPELASCHTAEVDGYVIEGHVPAAALRRLLAERPAATGLAVPGMPAGSPGMDGPGIAAERYEVVLFGPAGQKVFARFLGGQEA